MLVTAKKILNVQGLKSQLKSHGVSEEVFDAVFLPTQLDYHIITGSQLSERQGTGISLEIDTDIFYDIALSRVQTILKLPIASIEMDIYTSDRIFKESLRKKLGIRILVIVSETRVAVLIPEVSAPIQARTLLAIQQ